MRELEDILEEYVSAREALKHLVKQDDTYRDALLELEHRFVDIRADLRPHHTEMLAKAENRSDKSATAVKYRISLSMVKGEYEFKEGEKPMYDKPPTISSAEKYAAATIEYKTFLQQRVFYKESFVNIADLREDIQGYILLIKDKLKTA